MPEQFLHGVEVVIIHHRTKDNPSQSVMAEIDRHSPHPKNGFWHLSRSVNVGHIIAIVVLLVSLIGWASKLERGVDRNTQTIKHMESRSDERITDIKIQLNKINQRLDRPTERARQ